MQTAEQILQAMQKLGEKRLPLTRIYRCLYNEDLYLAAYGKLYRNQGALTPGTDENDTADGMSLKRIHNLIDALRLERFKFKPLRRTYLKKKSGGKRPLGLPNFSDKLVQEVLRMILQAYYEPQFCDSSHGYRPGRGCHTALAQLSKKFQGASWFIEGDIRGCFDNIDHDVLMNILSKRIQDGRILNLIRQGLETGVMEDWHYQRTYSGTPQGGVLSPLLSNIYLHELDTFIEEVLIPQYSYGKKRRDNPAYTRLSREIRKARETGDIETVKRLERERRLLPSIDTQDPNFRRLRYVRYADDFILSFIGPKSEAKDIKAAIAEFLQNELRLEMSPTKTLITHASTQHARFLNYAIKVYYVDDKLSNRPNTPSKMRSINGCIRLGIPFGLVDEYTKPYMRRGKPIHQAGLLMCSDAHIIDAYQSKYRGIANYYKFAVDRNQLSKLRYVMETSLVKTLASKFKITVSQVYRKYQGAQEVDGRAYSTLQVEVPTKRATRIIYWGAIPLKVVKVGREPLNDMRYREQWTNLRSDLVRRLQADTCELCGVDMKCEVHHVKKLADLKKRWNGRKGKPEWVKRMIAMERKTLVVCEECHEDIHAGRPIPNSRT
jgi:group II intron reverse transcriptase/maturase